MDTRLNIRQIQKIVIKYIDRRNDCIVVPNLSFGLLNHEADLAIINKSNRLTEIEIKRSYSDKAIAVIGDTRSIKDTLKSLGGRFNARLSCGAGWIFSKRMEDKVRNVLLN